MKNIFLLSILLMLGLSGWSQDSLNYNRQVTVGIHNNSSLFIYKSGLDKKWTKRYMLGGLYSHDAYRSSSEEESESGMKRISRNSTLSTSTGFGLQKNIAVPEKLTFFYGLDIFFGVTQKKNYDLVEVLESNEINVFSVVGDFEENKSITPATFGISLSPFIGANYMILDRVSIGLEHRKTIANVEYSTEGERIRRRRSNGNEYESVINTTPSMGYFVGFSGVTVVTASYYF